MTPLGSPALGVGGSDPGARRKQRKDPSVDDPMHQVLVDGAAFHSDAVEGEQWEERGDRRDVHVGADESAFRARIRIYENRSSSGSPSTRWATVAGRGS